MTAEDKIAAVMEKEEAWEQIRARALSGLVNRVFNYLLFNLVLVAIAAFLIAATDPSWGLKAVYYLGMVFCGLLIPIVLILLTRGVIASIKRTE